MLNSLSIKSENAFLYPCSIFDSISVGYCTSYPPAYLFAMGDRLPLYVIAERRGMNNMEGERTHKKPGNPTGRRIDSGDYRSTKRKGDMLPEEVIKERKRLESQKGEYGRNKGNPTKRRADYFGSREPLIRA